VKEISWIKKICFRNTPDKYSEITRFTPRGGIEGGGKIALKPEKKQNFLLKFLRYLFR
jgi:hypothetical protein